MAYTLPKLTFNAIQGSAASSITFDQFKGRPQMAKTVVETTTRLGATSVIVQKLRKESVQTSSTAYIVDSSTSNLINKIKILKDNIGNRGSFVDESGTVVTNLFLIDYSYTIREVNSGYLAEINLTTITDEGA
jgi:hypothetical protein